MKLIRSEGNKDEVGLVLTNKEFFVLSALINVSKGLVFDDEEGLRERTLTNYSITLERISLSKEQAEEVLQQLYDDGLTTI